jgi:guanyl-specific ribonuclease Sa
MRRRVPLTTRPLRTVFSAAAALLGACAPSTRGVTVATREGVVASAASSSSPVTTEYVEAQTVSFALDRIDQQSLPLDRAI